MIRPARGSRPAQVVFVSVPMAGMFVGSVLIHTQNQIHWMPGVAYAVGTLSVATTLALQFLILRFLTRVLRRRCVTLLEGVQASTILALLAAGTAVAAGLVLAAVRLQPGLATAATALFPGVTLLVAMAGALALAPGRRPPARRALVLVFAGQFLLTLSLRLL